MRLDTVQIQHFRNLESVEISPSSCLNFIIGQNGSGKSSLLEALHYMGFGRSFRTNKHKNVIQHEFENFSIFCKTIEQDDGGREGKPLRLGLTRNRQDELRVSVNGNKSNKMSEMVRHVPVQIFTPQSSELLIGSPSLRRKFLDWGLFHVEQSFSQPSTNYTKLLKQKNALLKKTADSKQSKIGEQMRFWDNHLAKEGETITKMREGYLEAITGHIKSNLMQFLTEFSIEISYYRGWDKSLDLASAIEKSQQRDWKNGYLGVGPHKADLRIKIKNVDVAEVLSRGQLRMLVAALQLAQIQHLSNHTQKSCIFLLDDVGAELDETKRELFIDKLIESDTQLFVTAIEKSQLAFIEKYNNKKVFHVEHGHMREES